MGISPEAFWRLSVAEWRLLTETTPGAAPMRRAELDGLIAAWPDDPPPSGEVARRAFAT